MGHWYFYRSNIGSNIVVVLSWIYNVIVFPHKFSQSIGAPNLYNGGKEEVMGGDSGKLIRDDKLVRADKLVRLISW